MRGAGGGVTSNLCVTPYLQFSPDHKFKLSYRREAAQSLLESFNISLGHSRSLKVMQNDTLEWGMCKSLLD